MNDRDLKLNIIKEKKRRAALKVRKTNETNLNVQIHIIPLYVFDFNACAPIVTFKVHPVRHTRTLKYMSLSTKKINLISFLSVDLSREFIEYYFRKLNFVVLPAICRDCFPKFKG